MKRWILPPPSNEVEELLAREREIPSQPEFVRRRALLRARTALWHARGEVGFASRIAVRFRQLRVVLASALLTSLGFGAWFTLARTPEDAPTARPEATNGAEALTPQGTGAPVIEGEVEELPTQDPAPDLPEPNTMGGKPLAQPDARRPALRTDPAPLRNPALRTDPTPTVPTEELSLLDGARRALQQGDAPLALARLQTHRKRFPNTQLEEEREALRVRALQRAGFGDEAQRAARTFQSRHPKSVFVPLLKDGE